MFRVDDLVLTTLLFQALVYVYMKSADCNFEEDMCGWSVENFLRTSSRQSMYDHTYKSDKGHYLSMTGNHSNATLESMHIYTEDFQCLTFWYQIRGKHTARIEVSVQERGSSRPLKTFTNLNASDSTWLLAIVETEVAHRTNLTFRLRGEIRNNGEIGLDDVAITPGSCLDCGDHQASCNWDGKSVWNMTINGVFTANTFYTSPRSESVLTSKSEIFPGQKCLSFQHVMRYNCTTYIQVRSCEDEVLFTSWKNVSDNDWKQISINISLYNKSRIVISFVHGCDCQGQYGIGRISLKHGMCTDSGLTTYESTMLTPLNAGLDLYHIVVTTTEWLETDVVFVTREATTTMKIIPSAPTCASYTTTTTTTSTKSPTTTDATSTNRNSTDVSADNSTIATNPTHSASTRISTMFNHSVQETTTTFKISPSAYAYARKFTTIIATSTISVTTIAITSTNINSTDFTANNAITDATTTPPAVTRIDTTLNDTAQVAVGSVIAIVIGCVVMIVVALLVAVCYYRRRRASRTRTKGANDFKVSNETNGGVSRTNNRNQNVRPSSEKANPMSETAHYNVDTEYAAVQMAYPRQSKISQRSISGKISVSLLAKPLQHNSSRNMTYPLQSKSQTRQNVDTEGSNPYDTMYDTKRPVAENTYSHAMGFRNESYGGMIACTNTTFDDTYDHTNFKGNSDNTYDHTNFTPDNTYHTTLQQSRQYLVPTYDHTCNTNDGAYKCITKKPTL